MSARAREISVVEKETLAQATPRSRALFERASKSMPLGVASSFQAADPYPIYLERGLGAYVWDVDGTSASTTTTASARWPSATPTRRSSRRSTRRPATGRTSR